FVIECIVSECMDKEESDYGELFVGTLESIVDKYSLNILLESVPHIEDTGVLDNSVTNGITFDAFNGFYNKVKSHAEKGRVAITEVDEEKALKLWRDIFGDHFPRSGVNRELSSLKDA